MLWPYFTSCPCIVCIQHTATYNSVLHRSLTPAEKFWQYVGTARSRIAGWNLTASELEVETFGNELVRGDLHDERRKAK